MTGRPNILFVTSGHDDSLSERGLFFKMSFFEWPVWALAHPAGGA